MNSKENILPGFPFDSDGLEKCHDLSESEPIGDLNALLCVSYLDEFSDKAKFFLKDLCDVCIKHKIQIAASMYDDIQLWDLEDGERTIHSLVTDKTK